MARYQWYPKITHNFHPPIKIATLIHHITSIEDESHIPTFISIDDITQTLQQLHLGDMPEMRMMAQLLRTQ